jgi:replicative DNA helicase
MNAPANIDSATLHSIELEQEILGAVLVNNNVFDVIENRLTASDFFEPLHSEIFDAIAEVRASHGVVTPALIIASIGGDATAPTLLSMNNGAQKDY